MKRGLVVTALLMVLMVSPAYADMAGMKMVQGKLGFGLGISDWSDFYDPGFAFGFGFLYGFHEKIMLDAEFNYTMWSGAEQEIAGFKISGEDSNNVDLGAGVRYFLMTEGMKPYVGGGLGIYMLDVEDSTEIGIKYGGGLIYNFNDAVSLDVGVKMNTVFADPDTVHYIAITGAIGFGFGM